MAAGSNRYQWLGIVFWLGRHALPHWMRHTRALARGAGRAAVFDSLLHASVVPPRTYLQSEEVKRFLQIIQAFAAR